ncbi:MAG: polysaccharide pyruvyl transferase family protein [Tannerella sp.]|jgi:colanic acid/amylovoran biosynthesis protein|nr:polysaccharide pyruvyl transferase family protein [Tannerella sp.]
MRIFITGQCTLHWGRLENGNIGNYYITETTFRELHRVFPEAELVTTFQLTKEFCRKENVSVVPMTLFYNWDGNDLDIATKELGIAYLYAKTGKLYETTPYIKQVLKSDLILDFSGELWGDHAEAVGKNRFLIGLIKDRVAQFLNKKTALIFSSEGPFSDLDTKRFAQKVLADFDVVVNRESMSKELLRENGFDVSRVHNFACPAFLFEPKSEQEVEKIIRDEKIIIPQQKTIGYILCGFNMLEGPYDKTPRRDDEFVQFAESIEYIINELNARVVLMSHQNGFEKEPEFKLINGRDFPIIKQLHEVLEKRGYVDMDKIVCIEKPYNPWVTKGLIKHFDMFITGRVHGFVAAVSQYVPTVLITRGFGPVSHRNIGFAKSVGLEEYIADPNSSMDMIDKITLCWNNRDKLRNDLKKVIPEIQNLVREGFNELKSIMPN